MSFAGIEQKKLVLGAIWVDVVATIACHIGPFRWKPPPLPDGPKILIFGILAQHQGGSESLLRAGVHNTRFPLSLVRFSTFSSKPAYPSTHLGSNF